MIIAGCFFVWTDGRTDGRTDRRTDSGTDTNKGVVEVQAIRLRTNIILYIHHNIYTYTYILTKKNAASSLKKKQFCLKKIVNHPPHKKNKNTSGVIYLYNIVYIF